MCHEAPHCDHLWFKKKKNTGKVKEMGRVQYVNVDLCARTKYSTLLMIATIII